MGVYKLTIPETVQESLNPNARNGSSSFKTEHQQFLKDHRINSAQPSTPKPRGTSKTTSSEHEEVPELEHFDDDGNSSVFTTSTRTSRDTISDDDDQDDHDHDSVLMEFASRAGSIDDIFFVQAPPRRHSTASCTDPHMAALRRKRLMHVVEPTVNEAGLQLRDNVPNWSFRRELLDIDLQDDRVDHESLALWEETTPDVGDVIQVQPSTRSRNVVNVHPAPHSWHAGDTAAASGSSRNKKKFFNGLFSGLNLSTSRRSRKSSR